MRLIIFLFFLLVTASVVAQDTRTTNTRIADALALLPAKDMETAKAANSELMALDDEGFAKVVEGVRPSGDAQGVPYRYAVALLATSNRTRLEPALLRALEKTSDTEVRQYYIQYLARIGTDRSVSPLGALLKDPALSDPATGALEAIGSETAMSLLRTSLPAAPASIQPRIIQALGRLRDKKAVSLLGTLASSTDINVRRESLWALAEIGEPLTDSQLYRMAAAVGFKQSPAGEVDALLRYVAVRTALGENMKPLLNTILMQAQAAEQQQLRLAVLKDLVRADPANSPTLLSKELDRFGENYRRDVLQAAVPAAQQPAVREAWVRIYRKSKDETQAEILSMLTTASSDSMFFAQIVLPALDSEFPAVRKVAIQSLGATGKSRYADRMASILINPGRAKEEHEEAAKSFLQVARPSHVRTLAKLIPTVKPEAAAGIVSIVSARRDVDDGTIILNLASSTDPRLRAAAFAALPNVASPALLDKLLGLLTTLISPGEIVAVQKALIAIAGPETSPSILSAASSGKKELLPVLPYLRDPQSLRTVTATFDAGKPEEKELAFTALTNWQNGEAVPVLLSILRKPGSIYHERAFPACVKQVMSTEWPADQKLLKLREAFSLAATAEERKLIIREVGAVRTFLSFVFVSSLLDDAELGAGASRAAMRLALPTADGQPGMTGQEVRRALEKVMARLTGPDSQYDRIDVQTYLDQLPFTQGFEPLFNGKDLSGWQGLVENPIARAKMTKDQLAVKQAAANAKLSESWSVKDGMICFTGTGDNLCTKRLYGDFELLVDWKISKNGDSGIYLRGSPQVQIWDTSRVDVGAQVGSGGLYNNTVNRNPLVVADNPIGDWNTLRITMIGERVTVYLNGILVVDNIVMENYWDRKLPIFAEGPIELQAHGTELAFRNVYVRELNRPYQLSPEEKQQGYELLFNSKDLSGWVGNKTDYIVEDQVIAIHPTGRGKGNLYTEKEYSDFVFRFEFQLTPAGNNGLGIHAPLEGDAAYVGKEIQILDDRHAAYKDIQPWQAHGSVYGVIAAKRDALRPAGQWNEEEVEVRGDWIKVTVNGVVIVNGDMKKASAKGTLDGKDHPGLLRHNGHIGFLGHGSVVRFRNIRILELPKK